MGVREEDRLHLEGVEHVSGYRARQLDYRSGVQMSPWLPGLRSVFYLCVRPVVELQQMSFTLRILTRAVFGIPRASDTRQEETFQIWELTISCCMPGRVPELSRLEPGCCCNPSEPRLSPALHLYCCNRLSFTWHFNIQQKGIWELFLRERPKRKALTCYIKHFVMRWRK